MWKLSTGLRNALLQANHFVPLVVSAATISFGDGTGADGADRILDSGNGLAGFKVGDCVTVFGSTSNNVVAKRISLVTAGYIEIPAGSLTTEAAGDNVVLASATGGSYEGIFRNATLHIYSGSQPATADDTESGTLLCKITLASGAFVADAAANGINFGQVASGVLHKATGEVWSGANIATGTAGWFRLYDNALVTGVSSTAIRLDGSCAASGAQLNLSSTSLTSTVTTTVDSVAITMPAS